MPYQQRLPAPSKAANVVLAIFLALVSVAFGFTAAAALYTLGRALVTGA